MKSRLIILLIFSILLFALNCFATTDSGNSGFSFIGYSKDGNQIAYLKYVEHYCMFNIDDGKTYFREYLGAFAWNLEYDTETQLTTKFTKPKELKNFINYEAEEKLTNDTEHLKIINAIKIKDNEKLYFGDKLIYKEKLGFLSFLHKFLYKDYNRLVMQLRIVKSGEYQEILLLYDIRKNTSKILVISPNMER